jgi:hypothetical protein
MDFTKDPNDRRRVDPETQRRRDAEVARLRAAKVPFRTIAERLNMSLGAVQKALRRHQKLMDALSSGEPRDVLAAITDEMAIEDVRKPEDVARLNILECYRARHLPADHPARRAMAEAYAEGWREPEPYRPTGPINDGRSWRERVDRAMGGDSGSDVDDW